MMVLPALPFFFEAEGKIIHITTMVLPNRFLAKNQDASILLMHGFIKKPLFPALHEMGKKSPRSDGRCFSRNEETRSCTSKNTRPLSGIEGHTKRAMTHHPGPPRPFRTTRKIGDVRVFHAGAK